MTVISYTAKREPVPKNFNRSGDDISISSVDNSFNSVTTDLSGLLQFEWIFADGAAAGNGWHQLKVDSTINKIETLSILTDEVAGNLIAVLGYEHAIGEQYQIETAAHRLDRSLKTTKKQAVSISGITETIRHRRDTLWDITSNFIEDADMVYWDEFMASVDGCEIFAIDLYGTIAAPGSGISVIMEGDPVIKRINSTKRYQISFKVKVQ